MVSGRHLSKSLGAISDALTVLNFSFAEVHDLGPTPAVTRRIRDALHYLSTQTRAIEQRKPRTRRRIC